MKICLYIITWALLNVCHLYAMVDLNENGMSDVWERKYQVVATDPAADLDDDGQTNLEEYHAGTDPKNSDSFLSLDEITPHSSALLVSWNTKIGQVYQVQHSADLLTGSWVDDGEAVIGRGGMMVVASAAPSGQQRFFRVRIVNGHSDLINQGLASIDHDTDGDGQSDLHELHTGYDPFDSQSQWPSPVIVRGESVTMSWLSEKGKRYQLQSRLQSPQGAWSDEGTPYLGSGGEVHATLVRSNALAYEYRLTPSDIDTDGDGLTDWEEHQVNLDPEKVKTDSLGDGDWLVLEQRLLANNVLEVQAKRAVANITRMEDGGVEFIRSSGLDELTIDYTVSGTAIAGADYVALTGSVILPFGQDSVVVPVTPLEGSQMDLSESVTLTLLDSSTYDLGQQESQQVNVIKEVAINVMDHGAVGDGITDDTLAIRAALTALEVSKTENTLYFPQGTYRLNQYRPDNYTITSLYRILTFGYRDMTGRDIIFSGDVDSKLYSTVSPTRAHMLVVISTFRSLAFRGMTWEKDSVPLSEKPTGSEPNGADGVSLLARDSRIVEHVNLHGCKFINCHGALMVYSNGYDLRGSLRQLGFYNCELLNPYGSNTINGGAAWGGGQQTYLSQWVGDAIYQGCLFEGGGEDMTDQTTSPGGRLKDAAMIGGPQRLIFTNNTVRRMGVEAVFNNGRAGWMSQTLTSMVVPPADGVTIATVQVLDLPTTFLPGQNIVLHTGTTPTVAGKDSVFRVVSYDGENRILGLVNDGYGSNDDPGTSIAIRGDIYLDDPEPLPLSRIEDNIIEGYFPPGADAVSYSVGVTMNTRARVRNNVIKGYVIGVMSYQERMPHPWSQGLVVDSNVIVTKDTSEELPFGVAGIRSWAQDQSLINNRIFVPLSKKTAGVVVYGDGSLIENNKVIAMKIERNAYDSSNRSVGLAVGNTAKNTIYKGNSTYGFDVGIGGNPYQSVPHRIISHYSLNDTLPIDPRGVIAE